jgi:hypothetical protein
MKLLTPYREPRVNRNDPTLNDEFVPIEPEYDFGLPRDPSPQPELSFDLAVESIERIWPSTKELKERYKELDYAGFKDLFLCKWPTETFLELTPSGRRRSKPIFHMPKIWESSGFHVHKLSEFVMLPTGRSAKTFTIRKSDFTVAVDSAELYKKYVEGDLRIEEMGRKLTKSLEDTALRIISGKDVRLETPIVDVDCATIEERILASLVTKRSSYEETMSLMDWHHIPGWDGFSALKVSVKTKQPVSKAIQKNKEWEQFANPWQRKGKKR